MAPAHGLHLPLNARLHVAGMMGPLPPPLAVCLRPGQGRGYGLKYKFQVFVYWVVAKQTSKLGVFLVKNKMSWNASDWPATAAWSNKLLIGDRTSFEAMCASLFPRSC